MRLRVSIGAVLTFFATGSVAVFLDLVAVVLRLLAGARGGLAALLALDGALRRRLAGCFFPVDAFVDTV